MLVINKLTLNNFTAVRKGKQRIICLNIYLINTKNILLKYFNTN